MIRHLESENIDKQKWDACIEGSFNTSIFAYSWYLNCVAKKWSALILNDYEAVFPIATKTKYKIKYAYQPFFSRYFGVFSKTKPSEKLVKEFTQAIPDAIKFIEFSLHESNSIHDQNAEIKEKKFQVLSLGAPYETIAKNYSENTKRSIKKAIKSGLTLQKGIEPEKIVSLFKTTKGGELEIFADSDYKTLIKLMNNCLDDNRGESLAVYDGDKLCAAAFFMFNCNKFTYLKNGITEEGKTKGAMYFLIDSFVREKADQSFELDFGGSSVDSVSQFYKKFGAKDFVYLQIKINRLPVVAKWIKKLTS